LPSSTLTVRPAMTSLALGFPTQSTSRRLRKFVGAASGRLGGHSPDINESEGVWLRH
jgi:hypothetical protein